MEWADENKQALRIFSRGLAFGAAGTIIYTVYRAVKTTPGVMQYQSAVRPGPGPLYIQVQV